MEEQTKETNPGLTPRQLQRRKFKASNLKITADGEEIFNGEGVLTQTEEVPAQAEEPQEQRPQTEEPKKGKSGKGKDKE